MERMKYALPIIVLLCFLGVIAFLILVNLKFDIFRISLVLGIVGLSTGIIGISTVLIVRHFRDKKK